MHHGPPFNLSWQSGVFVFLLLKYTSNDGVKCDSQRRVEVMDLASLSNLTDTHNGVSKTVTYFSDQNKAGVIKTCEAIEFSPFPRKSALDTHLEFQTLWKVSKKDHF